MFRKKILLCLIIVTAVFFLGCDAAMPLGYKMSFDSEEYWPEECDGLPASLDYANLDRLLADIAVAKFYEGSSFEREGSAITLRGISELYMPYSVPEAFDLRIIGILDFNIDFPISFSYGSAGRRTFFTWYSGRPTDEEFFHHYHDGGGVFWTQHGYEFRTEFHHSFTEQEIYDFSNAQPLIAWEIQGNAASLSVKGVESISIFNEDGYEIISEATIPDHGWSYLSDRHDLEHHSLYRADANGLTRVGYSWLVDADYLRRQYLFEPGTYTFHAEGVTGELGLLVKHFINGDIVSSTDYTAEISDQAISGFSITVTTDDSFLNIYQ